MDDISGDVVDVAALMDTSRIMTAVVAHSLAHLNSSVSVPQLRVLVMVDGRGPMNLSAVAEGLGVNASNASRACDKLVTNGLLDRQTDEQDRRSIVLSLTRKGKRLVSALMKERQAMFEQIVARMDPETRDHLSVGLRGFVAAAMGISEDGGLLDDAGHSLTRLV
jgi:DNA-binding MarR family transcriptional regulator